MKIKSFLKILFIFVILVFLGCCKKVTDKDGPLNPDEDCYNGNPLSPATVAVGVTAGSCHFEMTVHWAKYDPIEYRGPRVTVFATIKLVKAKNGSPASIFCDSFKIKDSERNTYKWDGLEHPDGSSFQQQLLTEGQEISGTVTIQVSKDNSDFTVIFNESRMLQNVYSDELKCKLNF